MSKVQLEQLDLFSDLFNEIIEQSMYSKLKEFCNIPEGEEIAVNDISFLPVYHNQNGAKTLKKIMLKHNHSNEYNTVSIDELEASGASWEEFIGYLKDCGANVVNPKTIY